MRRRRRRGGRSGRRTYTVARGGIRFQCSTWNNFTTVNRAAMPPTKFLL